MISVLFHDLCPFGTQQQTHIGTYFFILYRVNINLRLFRSEFERNAISQNDNLYLHGGVYNER